jgi:hypothetical protein
MKKELTRKELYELVWTESMVALSKKFAISDVGLRKLCRRFEIPVPKGGHWQKVRAGRKVMRPNLPESKTNEKISLVEMERTDGKKIYPWSERQREIERDPNVSLIVPEDLRHSDPLVANAGKALSDSKNKSWKFEGMRDSSGDSLAIVVEPKMKSRALIFMDLFIKVLRSRGHDVDVQSDATYAVIGKVRGKVQLKERSRAIVEEDGSNWPRKRFVPTGILAFKADMWRSFECVDGKRKIEEQISAIVARMELDAEELQECWRQNRIRQEQEEERRRLIAETKARKKKELKDFKSLLGQAKRWKNVRLLREFLADRKANGQFVTKSTDFDSWLEWANMKLEWYDPDIEREDDLLKDVDKNTLAFIE